MYKNTADSKDRPNPTILKEIWLRIQFTQNTHVYPHVDAYMKELTQIVNRSADFWSFEVPGHFFGFLNKWGTLGNILLHSNCSTFGRSELSIALKTSISSQENSGSARTTPFLKPGDHAKGVSIDVSSPRASHLR